MGTFVQPLYYLGQVLDVRLSLLTATSPKTVFTSLSSPIEDSEPVRACLKSSLSMEHSLTVAQAVSAISATFPGIDRDLAITGALLHDIGKLDAYELHGDTIEMSDQGRLHGEIALGYHRVRDAIEGLDPFPADTTQAVLHIILSHHGSLEYGSPVIPCTREATLVHMIDNLGGRLGSFDRLEKGLPAGEQWSVYDKGIGGGAYFAPPAIAERRAA